MRSCKDLWLGNKTCDIVFGTYAPIDRFCIAEHCYPRLSLSRLNIWLGDLCVSRFQPRLLVCSIVHLKFYLLLWLMRRQHFCRRWNHLFQVVDSRYRCEGIFQLLQLMDILSFCRVVYHFLWLVPRNRILLGLVFWRWLCNVLNVLQNICFMKLTYRLAWSQVSLKPDNQIEIRSLNELPFLVSHTEVWPLNDQTQIYFFHWLCFLLD